MFRFSLGVLAGAAASVPILIAASLSLPGPDVRGLGGSGTPLQTQDAGTVPDTVPYNIPRLGLAFDLPRDWDVVLGADYAPGRDPDARQTDLGAGDVFVVPFDAEVSGPVEHRLHVRYDDRPLPDVQVPVILWARAVSKAAPQAEIVVESDPVDLGGFDGARGTASLTMQIGGVDTRIRAENWVLNVNGGTLVLISSVPRDDPDAIQQMQRALRSLRAM